MLQAPQLITVPRALPRGSSRAARIVAAFGLCALGLGGVALVTTFVANPVLRPRRDTGMPREKLRELAVVAPNIDVLVLGTSRLLHGFDPRIFAAETARLGRSMRAYNLSLQRLLVWEQARVLDDALALPGLKPRLVLLEPAVGLGISYDNFTHARTVEFETAGAWRLAVSSVLDSDRRLAHKAWNIAAHSIVALLHALNYGLYTGAAFPPAAAATGEDVRDHALLAGFVPRADRPSIEPAPTWLIAMRNDYFTRFAEDAAASGRLPDAMRTHFLQLRERLARRGITVLFVQPPQLGFTTPELRELTFGFATAMRSEKDGPPVLSYLDPQRHPELFEPRWWMDYNHVSETGARLFTTELARDVVRTVAPRP